jgi:predicted transcriptional regulator
MGARKKATVYLDENLLRAAKILAARTDRKDYEVLEAALRQYMGVEVLERVWSRSDLSDDEALEIAYRELHAARRGRAGRDA